VTESNDMRPELPKDAARAAERVLRRRFGERPRLVAPEPLEERATVFRCRTEGKGLPDSVIVKMPRQAEGKLYSATELAEGSPAWLLTTEWASLDFLDSLQGEDRRRVSPKLYGGDLKTGILVLEDLGDGQSLAAALLGEDVAAAQASFVAFGRSLGRLHALTAGREGAYTEVLESLGRPPADRAAVQRRLRGEIEKLPATFEELEFEWSPGLVDDVQQVAASMLEPGPMLALTHGDPCPDNDRLLDGGMVLFDFERSGFRSAVVDGAYARVPFPTCWCVNRLPEYVRESFETAYRLELMTGVPEAGDDVFFEKSLMEAAGWWLIANANSLLPGALRFERRWGISTVRQRLLYRFEEFSRLAAKSGRLEALGSWAWLMHERMKVRWPEVQDMPVYPAFRKAAADH
jgi:hypothetical protein